MFLRRYLLCSVVLLAGCDMVTPPAKSATATPAPKAAPAAAPAKEAPAAEPTTPPPAAKQEGPKERQFCNNGRFEIWEGDVPDGWIANKDEIGKGSETSSGQNSVALKPSENYIVLEQGITTLPKGKQFRVSAKIKAKKTNDAVLKAVYMVGEEWKSESLIYRGDDQWKVTAFEVTLPAEASANTFRVQILRRPEAEGPVLVDDVSVAIFD